MTYSKILIFLLIISTFISCTKVRDMDRSIASIDSEQMNADSDSIETDIIEKEYTVKGNETLMMISFNLYGDYARWREIAEINQEVLKGSTEVVEGTKLKYLSTKDAFIWEPKGEPYLIKYGDTLGSISLDVYSTRKYWKDIWDNNRPLIKNPDKIFAGFTIYYVPREDIVNENVEKLASTL